MAVAHDGSIEAPASFTCRWMDVAAGESDEYEPETGAAHYTDDDCD